MQRKDFISYVIAVVLIIAAAVLVIIFLPSKKVAEDINSQSQESKDSLSVADTLSPSNQNAANAEGYVLGSNTGDGQVAIFPSDNAEQKTQENNSPLRKFKTSIGVTVEVFKEGKGAGAISGDTVAVHYIGYLQDGTKFDSSVDRKQPFVFKLGARQVIAGWESGIAGMKVGEIRRLYIPSMLAYGEKGTPGGPIPPNANLIFEVQMLQIQK